MTKLKENTYLREIPDNLLLDERVVRLANSLQGSLDKMLDWSEKIHYKRNLHLLPDEILDHLLWESHITWREGLALAITREQKIRLIESAVALHQLKGTPAALELVFDVLEIACKMVEWFQYGGHPYHFKLDISVTDRGLTEDVYKMLYDLVLEYKNVRSWLESIRIHLISKSQIYIGVGMLMGESITIYPYMQTALEVRGQVHVASGHRIDEVLTVYPQ